MVSFSGWHKQFVILEREARKEISRCFCTYLAKEIRNWISGKKCLLGTIGSIGHRAFSLDMVCMVSQLQQYFMRKVPLFKPQLLKKC